MTTATARRRKPVLTTVELREDRAFDFAPLAQGERRVDRAKCIIYGVKIAGLTSSNSHGVSGAEGSEYEPGAYETAIRKGLYEGVKVNVNHPPRGKGQQERDAEDRLGKIFNSRIYENEPYGDLHLLPSHRMTLSLLDAAESETLNDCFALSHNALGRGEVRNGRYVITEIPEVHSVDVVADGGTNRSLFEGREAVKTIQLAKLLEKKPALKPQYAKLLRAWPEAGEKLLLEADSDEPGDYRDHLHAAKKMCEDAGDYDTAKKIHGLMKPVDESEEDPMEKEKKGGEEKDGEETDAKDTASAGKGKGEEEKKAEESRRRRPSADPAVRELQERLDMADLREWVRKRCDAKEIPLTDKLLGTLTRLREHKAIDDHLDTLKELGVKAPKAARNGSAPRSSSPVRPVYESAAPKSGKELAAVLLR